MWAAAGYQVVRWRRHPADLALGGLLVALLSVAVAATLFVPQVQAALHPGASDADITDLVARWAVMVAAWSALALLWQLTLDRQRAIDRSRRELRWLAGAAALAGLLWAMAVE